MSSKIKLNKKIYVANLRFGTGKPELKALFSNAGDVMSVNIVKDRQTGQARGFAFVEMSTQWQARRAVSVLKRTDFMGKIYWQKRQQKNVASEEDSNRELKNSVIRMERSHYE